MAEGWTPEQLLQAAQGRVPQVSVHDEGNALNAVPVQFLLDGKDLVATFRWQGEPHLFGIRFPTSEAPTGPSTGGVCETPDEWAQEVGLVLMEELDTGLVGRGRREINAVGVVELDYHHNDPDFDARPVTAVPPLADGHYYRVHVLPPGSGFHAPDPP